MSEPTPTPMPTIDFESFALRYKEFERRAAELHPANRESVLSVLRAEGITRVVVTFDGCGDSGQIEAVEAWRDGESVDLPVTPVAIQRLSFGDFEPENLVQPIPEAIETLAYHYLHQTHAGWENNDGAYGEFVFRVAAGTIELDYNERFTDSTFYSHTF